MLLNFNAMTDIARSRDFKNSKAKQKKKKKNGREGRDEICRKEEHFILSVLTKPEVSIQNLRHFISSEALQARGSSAHLPMA